MLMPCRLLMLVQALEGYLHTGVPLVALCKGQVSAAAAVGADDFGLYYWGSLIGGWIQCDAQEAASWCVVLLLTMSFIFATTGCMVLARKWWKGLLCVPFLLIVGALSWWVGDVYVASVCAGSLIPWCIIAHKKKSFSGALAVYVLAGWGLAELNFIRSFAGLPAIVFFFLALVTVHSFASVKKLLLGLALCFGFAGATVRINNVLKVRDAYLTSQGVVPGCALKQHVFWHTIYIGLGYIHNDLGLRYDDAVGIALEKKYPGIIYPSSEYENVCQQECFDLIKKHPNYVMTNFAAKGGVVLYYLLLFAGWGFLLSFFYPRVWQWELPWWGALCTSALPGMMAIPCNAYLLGFITCCVLYALFLVKESYKL